MPNWCVGTLKIRGKFDDIVRFFKEGCETIRPGSVNIGLDDYGLCIEGVDSADSVLYLKGSPRHFIDLRYDSIYCEREVTDKNGLCYTSCMLRAAWSISPLDLLDKCEQYGLDMKILGFESGMEFNQSIEIVGGEIVQDELIKYNDYFWECPCPNLGG